MEENQKTENNKEELKENKTNKAEKTTAKKQEEPKAETKKKVEATTKSEVKEKDGSKVENKKVAEEQTRKFEQPKVTKAAKETSKTETKKKKHIVLKTILGIVIIALVIFFINFGRNIIIVNKIAKQQEELKSITNYACIMIGKNNKLGAIERYYKDGKAMLVQNNNEGQKIIMWNDTNTKETIILNPQELKATIIKDSNIVPSSMPMPLALDDEMLKWSFAFLITSDEIDGQECYKINYGETSWISKDNGTMLKTNNGKVVIDGKEYDNIVEYKNWQFNKLTDADLARPNLIGYTVTEQQ